MLCRAKGLTVLLVIMALLAPSAAMANSTPVYMENYPAFNIAPMKDSPIKVDREQLIFKIHEHSSEEAVVTASYTMTNISKEKVTVPLIFPFVSHGHGGGGAAKIQYNGKAVGYEIFSAGYVDVRDYLRDPEEFGRQVHIDTLIHNLNQPPYKAKHFADSGYGTLYEVAFTGPTERESRIRFMLDKDGARALTFGFNGFEMNDKGECVVTGYVRDHDIGEKAYILVMGRDTLAGLKSDYDDDIAKTTVIIGEFLMDYIANASREWLYLENRNIGNCYSLFVKEIDAFFLSNQLVFSEGMVMENMMYNNNISALYYEVEFEGDSTNSLVVTYPVRATIDRRKTNDYINTFAYILNPARNFAGFGEMDIQIELNSSCPYIIDSSIPLHEVEAGIYAASLAGLPSGDLVFSTYPRPEVTFLEATTARFLPAGYGRILAVFLAIFLGLATLMVILIKRRP